MSAAFSHDNLKHYSTAIGAGTASFASTLVGFPFDSVKTRMQTYRFKSLWHCVSSTYATEGVPGFFRGVGAPMVSVSLVRMAGMSIYVAAKDSYAQAYERAFGTHGLRTSSRFPTPASLAIWAGAGGTAGSVLALVACPFELTKLSTQIDMLMAKSRMANSPASLAAPVAEYTPKGTLSAAQSILRHRGWRGLYSGLSYHIARDGLGVSIYFTVYEVNPSPPRINASL